MKNRLERRGWLVNMMMIQTGLGVARRLYFLLTAYIIKRLYEMGNKSRQQQFMPYYELDISPDVEQQPNAGEMVIGLPAPREKSECYQDKNAGMRGLQEETLSTELTTTATTATTNGNFWCPVLITTMLILHKATSIFISFSPTTSRDFGMLW